MDSNRLRYFITVTETGSLRKAAEILRLSPAALSKAIKQLEEEAGFPLITPLGRGITVTDQGQNLALRAKPLIDGLTGLGKAMRDHFDEKDDSLPLLKLGAFEVFTTHFLSPLLEALSDQYSLLLRELIPGEMEKGLIERQIDYGITYIPIPTSGVEHLQVATIEMGIYGVKSLVHKASAFEEVPFVIPIQPIVGSPNKVQGLDGWPEDKIFRLVRHRVTLMESALEITRQGLAVCYLPNFVARLHNETVKAKYQLEPLPSPKGLPHLRQGVFIARRKSDLEGELFKKLAKALRVVCKMP